MAAKIAKQQQKQAEIDAALRQTAHERAVQQLNAQRIYAPGVKPRRPAPVSLVVYRHRCFHVSSLSCVCLATNRSTTSCSTATT